MDLAIGVVALGIVANYLYSRWSTPDLPSYRVSLKPVWSVPLENGISNNPPGSPRVADLNGDGVADVVIGGGDEGKTGFLLALDGKNGEPLWQREVADEVTPAPTLLDINQDGTLDAFVTGRKLLRSPLVVDGTNGKTIWSLQEANPDEEFEVINFLHVLPINDQDDDGLADLVIVQCGGDDERRIPARFFIVSAANGKILRKHLLPDESESYAMPLFHQQPDGKAVLYAGGGGETLPGSLFKFQLDTMDQQWHVPAQSFTAPKSSAPGSRAVSGKGFVSSPILGDADGDGRLEVFATGMDGHTYRIDANTGEVAWLAGDTKYEAYSTPAVGQFDGEPSLDVVTAFNEGLYPSYRGTKLVWRNGKTGAVIHQEEFTAQDHVYTASSPLVLDLNGDGRDEVLAVLSSNWGNQKNDNELIIFDGGAGKHRVLAKQFPAYSGSTPCLADIDGNGKLDIIHAHATACMRLELSVHVQTPNGYAEQQPKVRWGEYRGPGGSGLFE